jgi:hypothetical protein
MSDLITDITIQAVQLPRHQRLALAGFLLDLDDPADANVEIAWAEEIKSRIAAFDTGELSADDYADIQKRMQQRFAR